METSNADDGVDLFKKHSGEIKIVLLDLKMPGKDGWRFLAELRELVPKLPIVISSGFNPGENLLDVASVVYLPKPYTRKEFKKIFLSVNLLP